MKKRSIIILLVLVLFLTILLSGSPIVLAEESSAAMTDLRVNYMVEPIGLDSENPRFSWKMIAPAGSRGYSQTAYQIVVKDPDGNVTWDSGKVDSSVSVAIAYAGSDLQPATRYDWTVTVWDQNNNTAKASSWFETGLMSRDGETNWDGAKWIYVNDQDRAPMFRTEKNLMQKKQLLRPDCI